MISKKVYYEVCYVTKTFWPGRTVTKTFSNRKCAEKFFNSLDVKDYRSKSLLLHEESVLDRVDTL